MKNLTKEVLLQLKINKKLKILIIISFLIISIYILNSSFREKINNYMVFTRNVDLNQVINYIRGYGPYAVVISFILMVVQNITLFIPSFIIALANAAIFGWVNGTLLSWISSMTGAVCCFYISRLLGQDIVMDLFSLSMIKRIELFFERYGRWSILICRLLPFISYNLVSYMAGLTPMSIWSFIIATGLGQLPATIVYSYIGQNFSGGIRNIFIGITLLLSVTIIVYLFKKNYYKKREYVE